MLITPSITFGNAGAAPAHKNVYTDYVLLAYFILVG
jgi:hypothetical protein